jgi:hypothetical protein
MSLSQQERLCVFCIQNDVVMAGKKNPRRTGKTGNKEEGKEGKKMGIVESALDEESEDDLPDLGPKTDSDKDADFAGKLLSWFNFVRTDIQEPHNVLLLLPTTAAALPAAPKLGHHLMWGETQEELRASVNFEKLDGQDACGNKLNEGKNLTPLFTNNYDKLCAAVNNATGVCTECKDIKECDETVCWLLKLSGEKTEAMVFEGTKSLIDFAKKIKQSNAASVIKGAINSHPKAAFDPNVSCQPWFS